MKRYIKSTSETIPEELSSRPYVFILNSVNSTYNDDILEIAEKWGAIKVKYQQKIADTDKLYREGYWCFAVDEKATAQHIWDEVKAIKIPTHQDSLNIVKTNWDNNYNIWIDDYAAGTKKVKWHEKYPVKSSTDLRCSQKPTAASDNEEWADYLYKKFHLPRHSKVAYTYDRDALLSDLNNLRADEVLEIMQEYELPSTLIHEFKKAFHL